VLQQQRRRLWQHACIWQERKKDIQTFYFRILRLKIYLIKMGLPFELSLLSAHVCVCKYVCCVCEGVCVCVCVCVHLCLGQHTPSQVCPIFIQ
jgi:hypothetical protein